MRYLKAGEIVRATDEVLVLGNGSDHVWCTGSLNTGKKLPKDKVGLYRRRKVPLTPVPNDLLSRLKTVLPKVKNGMQSQTIYAVRSAIADCIDRLQ